MWVGNVLQQKNIVVEGKDRSGEPFPQTGEEMPSTSDVELSLPGSGGDAQYERWGRGGGSCGASLPGSGGEAWY